MLALTIGSLMVVSGVLAATHSLWIIRRAIRVWPRRVGHQDADLFLTGEFMVRYVGLLTAVAGFGIILSELF